MDQAWEIIADGNGTESLRRVAGRMRCPAKANSDEIESVSARPREGGDPDSRASWRDLDARFRGHERRIGSTLSERALSEFSLGVSRRVKSSKRRSIPDHNPVGPRPYLPATD